MSQSETTILSPFLMNGAMLMPFVENVTFRPSFRASSLQLTTIVFKSVSFMLYRWVTGKVMPVFFIFPEQFGMAVYIDLFRES